MIMAFIIIAELLAALAGVYAYALDAGLLLSFVAYSVTGAAALLFLAYAYYCTEVSEVAVT
jgi:hypothetical protein